jgi:hypothetical protein
MGLFSKIESGFPGLDRAVDSIRLGDNVVWQIDDVSGYSRFALAFAREAVARGRRVAYVRFARHPEIVPEGEPGILRYRLDALSGFEQFTGGLHQIITELGPRAFYVFDCLSELADAWATDLMIGNFFVATCPYLYELETVAYFGVLRNRHSTDTVARIRDTTQLFIELYGKGEAAYVQPLKVWKRYSATMFLPHKVAGGELSPVVSAAEAAAFYSHIGDGAFRGHSGKLDAWDLLFERAQGLCRPGADPEERRAMKDELCARLTCRDERIVALSGRWLGLEDLMAVKKRMIGSGYVGGKAAGMLLARKMLEGPASGLEVHDSFYVGSDVFYTYLVQNGLWRLLMRQKSASGYRALAGELRDGLSRGAFPNGIREQFAQMLEYYGQAPIIVRSSSLLEDGYGNAFAGKYESVFCANQGDPEERYRAFEDAVRRVYSSMMDGSALSYRERMGLSGADEQMALLVQRVSGSFHGSLFFPFLAGVADSRNAYPWKPGLDPKAGMLRLVIGLGTRAVDRTGDDWPRLVALDDPLSQPYPDRAEAIRHSQKSVDVLDLEANEESCVPLEAALAALGPGMADTVSARDYEAEAALAALSLPGRELRYADLAPFLVSSGACQAMRAALSRLEAAYDCPVDVEFTINPADPGGLGMVGYGLNVLQCRPLATRRAAGGKAGASGRARGRAVIRMRGGTMGGDFEREVSRIVYVTPSGYRALSPSDRVNAAQAVSRLNALDPKRPSGEDGPMSLLLTPGRCGSRMPELGLPVNFADICNFGAIAELSDPESGFAPELSYGSHFFRDLVEADIFYMALFTEEEGVEFEPGLILARPNALRLLLPASAFESCIHVCDFGSGELLLRSDLKAGTCLLYFPDDGVDTE